MKYEVTFESNGIYHSNLAIADDKEQVEKYFEEQNKIRNQNRRLINVSVATSDSEKPGKPVIYVNRQL